MKPGTHRVWVLSEFRSDGELGQTSVDYMNDAEVILKPVNGYLGISLWQAVGEPKLHLLVFEYTDRASAEHGLAAMAEGKMALVERGMSVGAPFNVSLDLTHQQGFTPHQMLPNQVLSAVIRGGNPGQHPDLDADLEMVMESLRQIPGFLGSGRGPRIGLEEEVISVALWDTEESFRVSLPPQPVYEVEAFRRLL